MALKRTGNMSEEQKKTLISIMENEEELRKGKFSPTHTFDIARKKWMDITENLNSIPGARKDWPQWKRAWQDLKRNVKKKHSEIKKHSRGTGGGPPIDISFTECEDSILKIMDTTSLEGAPLVEESIVELDIGNEDYHNISTNYIQNEQIIPQPEDTQQPLQQPVVLTEKIPDSNNLFTPKKETPKVTIKRGKKRVREDNLKQSVAASEKILHLSEEKLEVKKGYYEKKLHILENYYSEKLKLKNEDIECKKRIGNALECLVANFNISALE